MSFDFDHRNMHVAAGRNFLLDGVSLYVWMHDKYRDVTAVPKPLVLETIDDRKVGPDAPLLELSFEHATRLMDDLWNAGVRPTASKHSAEVVAAKDAHLADQRSVIDRLFGLVGKVED